jgi:hypothetical protein
MLVIDLAIVALDQIPLPIGGQFLAGPPNVSAHYAPSRSLWSIWNLGRHHPDMPRVEQTKQIRVTTRGRMRSRHVPNGGAAASSPPVSCGD